MKEIFNNINHIVVVGAWNMAILTEDWVKNNILNDVDKYTIEYPVAGSGSLKYSTEDFSFYIVLGRLYFNVIRDTDTAAKRTIEYARRLFRLLVHTPINAMGINFVFEDEGRCAVFDGLGDTADLTSAVAKSINKTEITRHFEINERENLNFKITQTDNITEYNFNFDYKVNTPLDIVNVFGDEDDILIKKKEEALGIISKVYKKQQS
jgi:hypothetical protein